MKIIKKIVKIIKKIINHIRIKLVNLNNKKKNILSIKNNLLLILFINNNQTSNINYNLKINTKYLLFHISIILKNLSKTLIYKIRILSLSSILSYLHLFISHYHNHLI